MAYVTSIDLSTGFRARAGRVLSMLGAGLDAIIEARSRADEIRFLYGLSDGELARRGLTRDAIPTHVFRDKLGL